MINAELEINMYFKIRNSELYGGKDSVGYARKSMKFSVSDTNTSALCLNMLPFAEEHIECMAMESGVEMGDVESISREEFESGASNDEGKIIVIGGWNEIRVVVDDGYLTATAATDKDYPGILVEFVANADTGQNASRPTVLLEKLTGESPRALVWEDNNNEDYTSEINFKSSNVSAISSGGEV